jgi:hypothetical protein
MLFLVVFLSNEVTVNYHMKSIVKTIRVGLLQ